MTADFDQCDRPKVSPSYRKQNIYSLYTYTIYAENWKDWTVIYLPPICLSSEIHQVDPDKILSDRSRPVNWNWLALHRAEALTDRASGQLGSSTVSRRIIRGFTNGYIHTPRTKASSRAVFCESWKPCWLAIFCFVGAKPAYKCVRKYK